MTLLQILFWLTLGLVVWTYLGYLVALKFLSSIRTISHRKEDITPDVSIVITAYNEETRISQKLDNTLESHYPHDKLEIIVVSDGSTDKTNEIVESYSDRGVRLLDIEGRHGKHYGQGRGIQAASNDIVVLTDATTFLEPDGIGKIVRNFADPEIGCVSSEDRTESMGSGGSGEGLYVEYEMKLRSFESRVCSLVGVSGSFYALRKNLCDEWIDNMSADFFMPIVAFKRGFRTVVESEATGHYQLVSQPQKEFIRKVRTVVHGLEVLFRFAEILNPFKYGLYALQMLSHKLSRWLVPFYLIALLGLNVALSGVHIVYEIMLWGQIALYGAALVGFGVKRLREVLIFKVPFFFVMVNFSILAAWYYYLTGKEFVVWEPTKR